MQVVVSSILNLMLEYRDNNSGRTDAPIRHHHDIDTPVLSVFSALTRGDGSGSLRILWS